MPLQATSGAASYDAFGGGVAAVPNYIEDVFSTWLYTGNGSTQTITNGVDLSTKGGLVWAKPRNSTTSHCLIDTARGTGKIIYSDATAAQATDANALTAFNTTGYSMGGSGQTNSSGVTYASWTFRKQPKFFDVVTFTSGVNGGGRRVVNHNLGSMPGMVIVKSLNNPDQWAVWHRSFGQNNDWLQLNTTAARQTFNGEWVIPTATTLSFTDGGFFIQNEPHVVYVFAHNAGGFGLTGTDNVISCGSYTGNSTSGVDITLGYEPQWVMIKRTDSTGNWTMIDTMRGFPVGSNDSAFWANTTNAELSGQAGNPTATGFYLDGSWSDVNAPGGTYIYIAIRRGPMKVPTDGTSVFSPNAIGAVSVGTPVTTNFPVDLQIATWRGGTSSHYFVDRLRGVSSTTTQGAKYLISDSSAAEATASTMTRMWGNTGFEVDTSWSNSVSIFHNFRRAPGYFDEVCWTGVGGVSSITHNLAATPELIIVKSRNTTEEWFVSHSSFAYNQYIFLNRTDAMYTSPGGTEYFGTSAPVATSTTFNVGPNSGTNGTNTYVAYLFATCPGVSKVGTYTGNGGTQAIACGFTGGARFVLIKRTNTSGDWYVYDTARGMTTSTDPYLRLNSTAAESATLGSVTTTTGGFTLDASVLSAINNSGSSYIFLAIA